MAEGENFKMSCETNQSGDTTFKLELDEDTSSMQTESEDLNSPQVNTENEMSKFHIIWYLILGLFF